MFKSKKEQIIQTKQEKSNKQTDSGKKEKSKSATKRPLLSKFFKNTTKDENKKNKVNKAKEENTIQSVNTTEKVDVSEKDSFVTTTHTQVEKRTDISPSNQVVHETVTREVNQTLLQSSNEYPEIIHSYNVAGNYETLRRTTTGSDETGKGSSGSQKTADENTTRKISAGKKSPKSPSNRKNKKGYPEISNAELVFTTANYSSQDSGNQSFDSSADDTSSPLFIRKAEGNEIHHSTSSSTTNNSGGNSLLPPESMARGDVKSEDMTALIDMLKDLTDSFGAPPAHDPSYASIHQSSPHDNQTPSTTPEREHEFRLAWQDEAKELSERLLKKIQEIEIKSTSKENVNKEGIENHVSNSDEFVTVSVVTDVESSNTIDFDREDNDENSVDITNKSNQLIDKAEDALPAAESVVHGTISVTESTRQVTTKTEVTSSITTNVSQSGGVFIFGNKFHSSKQKFQTLEKAPADSPATDSKVLSETIVTETYTTSAHGEELHGSPEYQETIVQQPVITITSEGSTDEKGSTNGSKRHEEEHIIEEKYVVSISSSHDDDEDLQQEDTESTVIIDPVFESNIEEGERSVDSTADVKVITVTTEITSGETEIQTNEGGDNIRIEVTEDEAEQIKVDETRNENVIYNDEPNGVKPDDVTDTGSGIRTTICLDIESSPAEEPEALLVKEKDGVVVISDVPLKKVEDFSQEISENIIKESLNESHLKSVESSTTETSLVENQSVTVEEHEGSPVSVIEHTTDDVDGVTVSNTTHSHSTGDDVNVDELVSKYKDSIEMTDALGNITPIKCIIESDGHVTLSSESEIEVSDAIEIPSSERVVIESPTEIIEEPSLEETIQDAESTPVCFPEGEITGRSQQISETDVRVKHSDTDKGHTDEICITKTTVSTEDNEGIQITKTVTHIHETKYKCTAEGDLVSPLATQYEIPYEAERKYAESPRDALTFQHDYTLVEGHEIPHGTVEVESQQSDMLPTVSEESFQEVNSNTDEMSPAHVHLHGDTSVLISINKSKDQIIDDDGFDEKDVDIQILRSNVGSNDDCNTSHHVTTSEVTVYTDSEPSVPVEFVIPVCSEPETPSVEPGGDKKQQETDQKTKEREIKQLISDIKEENKHIYSSEHLSGTDQCHTSENHDSCQATRRDQLVEQLLIKLSKAKKLSDGKSDEVSSMTKQKSFDADFIISLLNRQSPCSLHLMCDGGDASISHGADEPILARSEGYIEVNQMDEPPSRVSELAGIILKRYRSQYEPIQVEIIDPDSSESFIVVKESQHPATESVDDIYNKETVAQEDLSGEKHESEVGVEVNVNYTTEVTTTAVVTHTVESSTYSTNETMEIPATGNTNKIVPDECVSVETVPQHAVPEEIIHEDIMTQKEYSIEFPTDLDAVESPINESEASIVTIVDHVVHESLSGKDVISAESPIIGDQNATDDIESSSSIILPVDIPEVEVEQKLVFDYNDEEVPVDESIVTPVQKTDALINLPTDLPLNPVASTDGQIDTEFQANVIVCTKNDSDIPGEHLTATTEEVIDNESSATIVTVEHHKDVEIKTNDIINNVIVPIVTNDVEVNPAGVAELSTDVKIVIDEVPVEPSMPTNVNVDVQIITEKKVITSEEKYTSGIQMQSDILPPQIPTIEENNNDIILISEPPSIEVRSEETQEPLLTGNLTINDRQNFTSSVIITDEVLIREMTKCDRPPVSGHPKEADKKQGKKDELVAVDDRANLTSSVIIDNDVIVTEEKSEWDAFDDFGSQGCDMITIFKALRNQIETNAVETPDVKTDTTSDGKMTEVSEEFVTAVHVNKEESGVSLSSRGLPTKELITEPSNGGFETSDAESKTTIDNASPHSSTESLQNGKLKKRPTASFRKLSVETNTTSLSDKIRRSIEGDTKSKENGDGGLVRTVHEEVNTEITVSDQMSSIAPESFLEETQISNARTSMEGNRVHVEGMEEEEKPLYIVCKDVNQTNIITSSRARMRDDDGTSRSPSPNAPTKHSPIIRLTSTPPQQEVQNTPPILTTDNGGEFKINTHEKRVMVQTQFFYEMNDISVEGTTNIQGIVNREPGNDHQQQRIGASNTYGIQTNITNVPREDLIVANTEHLQESEPTIYSNEVRMTEYDIPEIPDMDNIYTVNRGNHANGERGGINNLMTLLSSDGGVEPVLQRAELSEDAILQRQTNDRVGGMGLTGSGNMCEVTIPRMSSSDTISDTAINREQNVDLVINNGQLVEQPDDQMYRDRYVHMIPEQTVTLTSRELPKCQNIYIEMRSRGEVPVEADIDPYLSEIHFKDIKCQWQDQKLLSPTYTSFQQIIIDNHKTKPNDVHQSVSVVNVENGTDSVDNREPSPMSNDTSRSSPEVTFNKDVHESLQNFCDGLLTGLFKGNEVPEEDGQAGSETTIKIDTNRKPITDMLKEKNTNQETEKAPCRVFKCDEAMLRQELRESLHDDDTTTQ